MSNQVPGERTKVYLSQALPQVPRLLSLQDREPHSPTYGAFDRDAWSWKFRDFPLGMAQTAVYPLALLWRHPFAGNPYYQNERCLEWIAAGMERAIGSQHPNGAMDAWAPNEFDVGPTLGIAHGVAEALRLVGPALPAARVDWIRRGLRKAFDFGLPRQEKHGFISNHLALFAVSLLDAHEIFGDVRYRQGAEELIQLILAHQSVEGWYREYGGMDPGYESLGIHHLATYWQRTRSDELRRSIERAVECFAHFVHPDGSVGGVYGSRGTALYYPGGFELLAGVSQIASTVASFMRQRLDRGNVVTPMVADLPNLTPMLYSYLEAAVAARHNESSPGRMPCELALGTRTFPEAGMVVAGGTRYYAVINGTVGGVCRVFNCQTATVAYEDGGYVVTTPDGLLTSQARGLGRMQVDADAGTTVTCETPFTHLRHQPLTPARMILLRILNLTLFRVEWLAGWFRRQIVKRLVSDVRRAPVNLHRTIRIDSQGIRIDDVLTCEDDVRPASVLLTRSCAVVHAGSARYFHPAELAVLDTPVKIDGELRAGSPLRRSIDLRVGA